MRLLAGAFDPSGHADGSRLALALAPHEASVLREGALQLAYSGPGGAPCRPGHERPLCLLDGFVGNLEELADELGEQPHTDPERLLALGYRRWGMRLPKRMRGEFVLLVWDAERNEGLIARDQMGVRCMYLSEASGRVRFATEIHHLLALLPTRPGPDPVSVAHWIAASNRPGATTLYAGVRRLNPGALLALDRHGAREQRYWAPRFREPALAAGAALEDETLRALGRAVGRRIDTHGGTGVLMSGGLDSASVAALAAELAPGHVTAYAGVFPEHPTVDESQLIDELRDTLALSGLTAQVRPGGLLASALESTAAWQLPLLGWSDFWTLPLLRAAAATGVTHTLGGDGGDELFGARVCVLADRLRAGRPLQALRLSRRLPGAGSRPPRREVLRVLASCALSPSIPYAIHDLGWRALGRRRAPSWMRGEPARELVESDDPFAWKRLDGPRWWAQVAHGVTRGVEETGVFEHQRLRARLAGVEARHPFFDLDLVELALRQRPEATLDPDLNRPVLRASMAGRVPESVRTRPRKAWFDALIGDCLDRADGAAIRQLLTDPDAELRAYVDQGRLRANLLDCQPHIGGFQRMHRLWRLASAECWLRAQRESRIEPGGRGLRASPARIGIARAGPAAGASTHTFFHLDPADASSTLEPID
jgi:asparagine synthase (glutamine-hydrolysing)